MRAVFVGRERELEALRGSAGLALISGPPGVGKTRLAEELVRRTGSVIGRASDGTPFGPWVQILRQLGREFPEAATREALFEAVERLLPPLVVIDDLDAADASSRWLLQLVARERFVVATVRSQGTLPLSPLGKDELSAWIAQAEPQLTGDLDRLFERSQGNPLFVSAVLAVAHKRPEAWSLPGSLSEALRQHLSLLSSPAAGLLQTASVLGCEFTLRDLNALVPAPSVLIDEAAHLGVLVDGERLRFTHDLLRDELYAWVPAERRRSLHAAAAIAAESPEAAARHQLLAGGPEAPAAIRAAVKDAERRLAFETAEEIAQRAEK